MTNECAVLSGIPQLSSAVLGCAAVALALVLVFLGWVVSRKDRTQHLESLLVALAKVVKARCASDRGR